MKKILALVLALCMVLVMCAGCGSSSTSTASTSASSSTASSSTASSSTASSSSSSSSTAASTTETAAAGTDTAAATALPVASDFEDGGEWDGTSEPTTDVGPWAQSYAVIAALHEQAAAYDNVTAEYTFTLACHDPENSAPGEFLSAWMDAVTIATEGKVDFNPGWSGVHSGTMASLTDMINGVVDFDWTLPCYFKGYMPLTNVIQNPALHISNATVGSYAMWDLYNSSEEIQAEFADDGELLFVWTNCTSPLSYKGDHEITSVSEIVGNIRGNNGPAQLFVAQVGATVYGCPITDVYNNVSSGIINYLITDWHGIKSFSLADVLNYYVDTNIGCSAYCLMSNADTWALLESKGYADAIKSVSGDYLLNLVSIWDYWEASGRYAALEQGGIIFEPSAELSAELDEAYDAVAQTWISEQDDPAVAQSIYDQAKALVDQYNEIYG